MNYSTFSLIYSLQEDIALWASYDGIEIEAEILDENGIVLEYINGRQVLRGCFLYLE